MSIDIESLGFTKEELQERVIERLCEQFLTTKAIDQFGDEAEMPTRMRTQLEERIKATINERINAIAEAHILPNVAAYIEELTLQQTTQWGEKKGEPVTFIEYLVARAKAYMQEQVDHDGKSKEEGSSYGWSGKQTRITHLIHAHLQYSISTAMKDALQVATGEIAKGIHETCRLKLNEIAASMKVAVATR